MPHVLTVFGVIGLILLTIGIVGLNNTIQWVTEAERTDGTVVRISAYSTVSDGVTTTMYSPVVSFIDKSGNQFTFSSNVSSSSVDYKTGDKIPVLYNRDKPEEARVKSFFSLWGVTLIVGGIGLIFTAMGVGYLIYVVRKKYVSQS